MSQEEIKQWLLNKRLSGDENFFTIKEISKNMKEGKRNIHKNINKLYLYQIIEQETSYDRDIKYGTKHRFIREFTSPRRFRISRKIYIEGKEDKYLLNKLQDEQIKKQTNLFNI